MSVSPIKTLMNRETICNQSLYSYFYRFDYVDYSLFILDFCFPSNFQSNIFKLRNSLRVCHVASIISELVLGNLSTVKNTYKIL